MEVHGDELEVLDREECLALLSTVPVGRIVFTDKALPAIQPVSFVVDGDAIVVRAEAGSTLARTGNVIVAFEVDEYDAETRTGWYVTVTGHADHVGDPDEAARLARRKLQPWAGGRRDRFIRIKPELVSGRRFSAAAQASVAPERAGS